MRHKQEPDRIYERIQLCARNRYTIFIHNLLNRDKYIIDYTDDPSSDTIDGNDLDLYLQRIKHNKDEV